MNSDTHHSAAHAQSLRAADTTRPDLLGWARALGAEALAKPPCLLPHHLPAERTP